MKIKFKCGAGLRDGVGCGASLSLRPDKIRFDGHGWIKCPICHSNMKKISDH